MMDKIRVSVDEETEKVLERVIEGIGGKLEEEPPWAGELHRTVCAKVDEIRKGVDEDIAQLQKDLVAVRETLAALNYAVRRQQEVLDRLARPWWRKLFGR